MLYRISPQSTTRTGCFEMPTEFEVVEGSGFLLQNSVKVLQAGPGDRIKGRSLLWPRTNMVINTIGTIKWVALTDSTSGLPDLGGKLTKNLEDRVVHYDGNVLLEEEENEASFVRNWSYVRVKGSLNCLKPILIDIPINLVGGVPSNDYLAPTPPGLLYTGMTIGILRTSGNIAGRFRLILPTISESGAIKRLHEVDVLGPTRGGGQHYFMTMTFPEAVKDPIIRLVNMIVPLATYTGVLNVWGKFELQTPWNVDSY